MDGAERRFPFGVARLIALALLVSACQSPGPTVTLPPGAPLTAARCPGWPASPPLAFAGWATRYELGLSEAAPDDGTARVFALVTRDAIDQPSLGAPGDFRGRGICLLQANGSIEQTAVPDDWTLRALPTPR